MNKSFNNFIIKTINYKVIYLAILIILIIGCKEDMQTKGEFEFQYHEIIYYPDKHISITFDIVPKDYLGSYQLNWFSPDTLNGTGPFTINISNNIILDFEILDKDNNAQRFQHEIKTDTIDSLKFDYRNKYIGKYFCSTYYSYHGEKRDYLDTLIVEKDELFNKLIISTLNEIRNNLVGNGLTYANSNGTTMYQTDFFCGSSLVLFFSK